MLGTHRAPRPAAAASTTTRRRRPQRAPATRPLLGEHDARSAPGSTSWTGGRADGRAPAAGPAPRAARHGPRRGQLRVVGRTPRASRTEPGSRATPPSSTPRPARPAPTSRSSPARAASAAAGWRSWSASSRFLAGSIGRAAAERMVLAVRARHPRGAAAASPPRPPAAPACRRAPRRSCTWSRSPRPWRRTRRPDCPTSSTCATRRPAACSPRGGRSAT